MVILRAARAIVNLIIRTETSLPLLQLLRDKCFALPYNIYRYSIWEVSVSPPRTYKGRYIYHKSGGLDLPIINNTTFMMGQIIFITFCSFLRVIIMLYIDIGMADDHQRHSWFDTMCTLNLSLWPPHDNNTRAQKRLYYSSRDKSDFNIIIIISMRVSAAAGVYALLYNII